MAKLKTLKDKDFIGGNSEDYIYPITHTKAVYNSNNENLDQIITDINQNIQDLLDSLNNQEIIEELKTVLQNGYIFKGIMYPSEGGGGEVPGNPDVPTPSQKYTEVKYKHFYITGKSGNYIYGKLEPFTFILIDENNNYEIKTIEKQNRYYHYNYLRGKQVVVPNNNVSIFEKTVSEGVYYISCSIGYLQTVSNKAKVTVSIKIDGIPVVTNVYNNNNNEGVYTTEGVFNINTLQKINKESEISINIFSESVLLIKQHPDDTVIQNGVLNEMITNLIVCEI